MFNNKLRLLFLFSFLLLAGCAVKTVNGDESIYTNDWKSLLLAIVACLGVIAYAVHHFSQKSYFYGAGSVFVALLLLLFFIPGLVGDKVTITPSELTSVRGGFFSGQNIKIRFDEIKSVTITLKKSRGRRGRVNKHYTLNFQMNNGQSKKLSLGTLMEEAFDEFMIQLNQKGIPIINQTGE